MPRTLLLGMGITSNAVINTWQPNSRQERGAFHGVLAATAVGCCDVERAYKDTLCGFGGWPFSKPLVGAPGFVHRSCAAAAVQVDCMAVSKRNKVLISSELTSITPNMTIKAHTGSKLVPGPMAACTSAAIDS